MFPKYFISFIQFFLHFYGVSNNSGNDAFRGTWTLELVGESDARRWYSYNAGILGWKNNYRFIRSKYICEEVFSLVFPVRLGQPAPAYLYHNHKIAYSNFIILGYCLSVCSVAVILEPARNVISPTKH